MPTCVDCGKHLDRVDFARPEKERFVGKDPLCEDCWDIAHEKYRAAERLEREVKREAH